MPLLWFVLNSSALKSNPASSRMATMRAPHSFFGRLFGPAFGERPELLVRFHAFHAPRITALEVPTSAYDYAAIM